MFVVGLGVLAAGPFSGYWESELTIGFKDVTVTDPGATLTIPGGTYSVTQGTVTIGTQIVTGTYLGESYTVTVPGGTYWVGPWDVTIPGGTYDVTQGTVDVPAQTVTVDLPDGPVEVDFPGYSFDIPALLDKECLDMEWPIDAADAAAPEVEFVFGGIEDYFVEVTDQGPDVQPYDSDTGVTTVPVQNGALAGFDWCTLEFATGGTIVADSFLRDIQVPIGSGLFETLTFKFDVVAGTVDHDDWVNGLTITLAATQTDSLNRVWTAEIYVTVEFTMTKFPAFRLVHGTSLGECVYDGMPIYFTFDQDVIYALDMPAGWPWEAGRYSSPDDCAPRPTVTLFWDGQGWVFRKATDDLFGPCLITFGPETLVVSEGGTITGALISDALFATLSLDDVTVTIPAMTLSGTYEGGTVDVVIPAQDGLLVSAQTVTIPDIDITIPADSIMIPDYTFTITVEDQDIDITIPGGTYAVSAQTVTIPAKTVTVPGWSQTIDKLVDLGFTSTLSVDYTVCNWVFNSTSTFADGTGWDTQSFSADGDLGAFSISSSLTFDPPTASFLKWDSSVEVSIAGVTFGANFVLDPDASGFSFSGSGVAGNCNLAAVAYFNLDADGDPILGNCVCFTSVHFDFDFSFACIELVDVDLDFSADGFDGITFTVAGVTIPNIPWLGFDISVTFDDGATGKVVSVTPSLNFGAFDCITLYGGLIGTFPEITGFNIYGAKLSYTWNGITFTDVTSFDYPDYYVDSDLSVAAGEGEYWEALQLKFDADACCGGGFDFSVTTFFENDSGILFDWGETIAAFSMGIGSNYTVSTSLTIDDMGLELWKLGFKVTF